MEVFKTIWNFAADKKTAIGYSVMGLMTIGGQQLFSLVAFKCPCSHQNVPYGFVFLFVPALVLLGMGYFLNSATWKLFTGCCVNPRKIFPKGHCCRGPQVFLQVTMKAFFAPVLWLSMALLNGTFYECAMSDWQTPVYVRAICANKSMECPKELHKVVCGKTSMPAPEREEILRVLQAESQILGWGLIVTTVMLSLLYTCQASCRSKVSYLQMTFWRTYIEKEKEHFDKLSEAYASKLAERNLTSFFENKEVDPFELPSNKAWEEVSSLYFFTRERQYYSTLHRHVEQDRTCVNKEEETMLDFVDGKCV
ncbi:calcium homeostasis modulator protein 5 [Ambystoma mexicanum]|uniref:calcium homeostasis modulator protein 5 n=1 Tax=Ambystoma mexicanum TaxID=8296 RepID=UPI0037E71D1D